MAHFDLKKDSGYLQIESAFKEAISHLADRSERNSFLDLTVMVDLESVELFVYDEEHICLSSRVIDVWAEYESVNNEIVIASIREVLKGMQAKQMFTPLDIYRPIFINFADENYSILSELLYLDDNASLTTETGRKEDPAHDLIKEFDIFIDGLISED